MAPASKQSLLSIDAFVKNPKKSTLKAHQKMARKNGLIKSSIVASKKTAKVDKKEAKRIEEENVIRDGGAAWQQYMDMKGFDNVKRHDPCLLFQVYGPPLTQMPFHPVMRNRPWLSEVPTITKISSCSCCSINFLSCYGRPLSNMLLSAYPVVFSPMPGFRYKIVLLH